MKYETSDGIDKLNSECVSKYCSMNIPYKSLRVDSLCVLGLNVSSTKLLFPNIKIGLKTQINKQPHIIIPLTFDDLQEVITEEPVFLGITFVIN